MTGQPFDTADVNSVHWLQPSDWSLSTVHGVNAYWMRCVVASVSTSVAPPVQQNRHIYSILWPYAEIQADKLICIPISMRCTGTLSQVYGFCKSLQSLDRIVRIENIRLSNDSEFTGRITMQTKATIYYREISGQG